jgi:hypothetical protein
LYDFILYKFVNFFVEMSTTKNEKCKGKHFTCSKPMSHMLLEILAEEALFCINLWFFFIEMSTTKNEKCKGKHFTWSKPMSHMLLEILAEETLKGNKPSSTFKAESFV